MAETTGISWCHATLNFFVGCTKVSNGDHGACAHCYAETWALRWPAYRNTWGAGAARVQFKDTRAKALKLERLAVASGEPFYCFSNSLSDIFDNEVPIEWLASAFEDMRAAPHVTFLLLTKRAPNIQKRADAAGGLPANAAIGATVVTQEEADRDIPHLLRAKEALKPRFAFLSMEPLMGPVDLRQWLGDYGCGCGWGGSDTLMYCQACGWRGGGDEASACGDCGETLGDYYACPECDGHDGDGASFGPNSTWIDWVITGGESGANARPTHPDWLRSIRDACAAAGVPYHHKQNGEWAEVFPGGETVEVEADEQMAQDILADIKVPGWVTRAGARYYSLADLPDDDTPCRLMERVGKKASGRLLDGVLHDAMPEVRS